MRGKSETQTQTQAQRDTYTYERETGENLSDRAQRAREGELKGHVSFEETAQTVAQGSKTVHTTKHAKGQRTGNRQETILRQRCRGMFHRGSLSV